MLPSYRICCGRICSNLLPWLASLSVLCSVSANPATSSCPVDAQYCQSLALGNRVALTSNDHGYVTQRLYRQWTTNPRHVQHVFHQGLLFLRSEVLLFRPSLFLGRPTMAAMPSRRSRKVSQLFICTLAWQNGDRHGQTHGSGARHRSRRKRAHGGGRGNLVRGAR